MARIESTKRKALELIQNLPTDSDWDDIMREIYVRKKIEAGIRAANAGRTVAHEQVRARFRRPQ